MYKADFYNETSVFLFSLQTLCLALYFQRQIQNFQNEIPLSIISVFTRIMKYLENMNS